MKTISEKLNEVKDLFDKGVISEAEYNNIKASIIEKFKNNDETNQKNIAIEQKEIKTTNNTLSEQKPHSITVKHKKSKRIETVNLRMWEKMKKEYGESNYEIISYNKKKEDDNKNESSSNENEASNKNKYLKWVIAIVLFLSLTLPFHYVPSHFRVFPKDNLTFSNTIITKRQIDIIIERHNNANYFEKLMIREEPLTKKLFEKGILTTDN